MLGHEQDENVTINLQKNQGFNLENVEIREDYQEFTTRTVNLEDKVEPRTKKQTKAEKKYIDKLKKEIAQEEKERAEVMKKRQFVQQHQEQIDLGFEKPTYQFLMDKKWLYYYDNYDLNDVETAKLIEQELKDYSKIAKQRISDLKEEEAAQKKALKAEEKRKRMEEVRRRKKDAEDAKKQLLKDYRGEYSEKDGGIIGKYLAMMKQYQEETGFFHDGVITIQELKQYEDMIHGKQKQKKPFLKEFRKKIVHQMIVDHSFANVMSEYSDDYKMLAAQAQAEEKQLEYVANLPGQDKLAGASELKERERCRAELHKLRIAQEDNWRSRVNDEKVAERSWKQNVNFYGVTDFDSSIFEERAKLYDQEVFTSDTSRFLTEHDQSRGDESEIDEFRKRRNLKKLADKNGISLGDVAALTYDGQDRQFDSQAITDTTSKLILATGEIRELTKEEQKKMPEEKLAEHQKKLDERSNAYHEILDTISTWGQSLADDEEMKKLSQEPLGIPDRYYEEKSRHYIIDTMYKCDRMYHLMLTLSQCQMYHKLSKEQVMKFEETCHWLIGYHEWLTAHHTQMKAWDNYFGESEKARKDIPYDEMPKQMEKITHYFK